MTGFVSNYIFILACFAAGQSRPAGQPAAEPIETVVHAAIDAGKMPGAVVLVGRDDEILYRRAFGDRAIEPSPEPMTSDTIFDLASLTKPVVATAVMILAERGRLDVHAPVARYWPAFGIHGKEAITVEQLLLHVGGLVADNSLEDYRGGRSAAMNNVCALTPIGTPGTRFVYSDVGYIVLGELVRRIDGRPLDRFCAEEIFEPLEMRDTGFHPPARLHGRCAPTERRGGRWLRGQVHDPRAAAMDGVAGHAGLFSTADDLARYCRMILNGGQYQGRRILSSETVAMMTRPHKLPGDTGLRAYGFDVDTAYSSPRGNGFTRGTSFGHTGFTGTSFWIDPDSKMYVIILTSRLHPDGKGRVIELRRTIGTLAAKMAQ